MAENVPQVSADSEGRGVPYYEKLKRDLRQTLIKKQQVDKQLAEIEESIFYKESAYLEETNIGNIIKGFDNYIKGGGAASAAVGGTASRRKNTAIDNDRVFSRSSTTYAKEKEESPSDTPVNSHAATPTAKDAKDTKNAKRNKKATKEEEEIKPNKRFKLSYARGEKNGG